MDAIPITKVRRGTITASIASVRQPKTIAPFTPHLELSPDIPEWIGSLRITVNTQPPIIPELIANIMIPATDAPPVAATAFMDSKPAAVAAMSAAVSS